MREYQVLMQASCFGRLGAHAKTGAFNDLRKLFRKSTLIEFSPAMLEPLAQRIADEPLDPDVEWAPAVDGPVLACVPDVNLRLADGGRAVGGFLACREFCWSLVFKQDDGRRSYCVRTLVRNRKVVLDTFTESPTAADWREVIDAVRLALAVLDNCAAPVKLKSWKRRELEHSARNGGYALLPYFTVDAAPVYAKRRAAYSVLETGFGGPSLEAWLPPNPGRRIIRDARDLTPEVERFLDGLGIPYCRDQWTAVTVAP